MSFLGHVRIMIVEYSQIIRNYSNLLVIVYNRIFFFLQTTISNLREIGTPFHLVKYFRKILPFYLHNKPVSNVD